MKTIKSVPIGTAVCGPGQPLLWILGPCVIESHELTLSPTKGVLLYLIL